MKLCVVLLFVTIIAEIYCAQLKTVNRESRYPTREPQGLFPDVKVHHSRTYRSARQSQANNYKFDEELLNDQIMPRQDKPLVGRPGALLLHEPKTRDVKIKLKKHSKKIHKARRIEEVNISDDSHNKQRKKKFDIKNKKIKTNGNNKHQASAKFAKRKSKEKKRKSLQEISPKTHL